MLKVFFAVSVVTAMFTAGCLQAVESIPKTHVQSSEIPLGPHIGTVDDIMIKRHIKECLLDISAETKKQFALPQDPEDHDLVEMVICCNLMNDLEKQYWFDIMPKMTAEQKNRLKCILGGAFKRDQGPIMRALGEINR